MLDLICLWVGRLVLLGLSLLVLVVMQIGAWASLSCVEDPIAFHAAASGASYGEARHQPVGDRME